MKWNAGAVLNMRRPFSGVDYAAAMLWVPPPTGSTNFVLAAFNRKWGRPVMPADLVELDLHDVVLARVVCGSGELIGNYLGGEYVGDLPRFDSRTWIAPLWRPVGKRVLFEVDLKAMKEQKLLIADDDLDLGLAAAVPYHGNEFDLSFASHLFELLSKPASTFSEYGQPQTFTWERLAIWKRLREESNARRRVRKPVEPVGPRPKDVGRVPEGVELFWSVVDAAAASTAEEFLKQFTDRVMALKKPELRKCISQFAKLLRASNRCGLWGAAYLMNGGCSDDGFLYWRCWLLAQGRDVYESAMNDPDSLATAAIRFGDEGEYELEDLIEIFQEAMDEASIENDALDQMEDDPKGPKWDVEDEAQSRWRLPALWRRYAAEDGKN